MNRLIKFRVFIPPLHGTRGRFEYAKDISLYNPEDLQQYVGLLDINGKEIFEGDILTGVVSDLSWGFTKITGRIEYNPIRTSYDIVFGSGRIYLWKMKKEIEIIGNIYENPELLKNYE